MSDAIYKEILTQNSGDLRNVTRDVKTAHGDLETIEAESS